jgi:hypothetical protein
MRTHHRPRLRLSWSISNAHVQRWWVQTERCGNRSRYTCDCHCDMTMSASQPSPQVSALNASRCNHTRTKTHSLHPHIHTRIPPQPCSLHDVRLERQHVLLLEPRVLEEHRGGWTARGVEHEHGRQKVKEPLVVAAEVFAQRRAARGEDAPAGGGKGGKRDGEGSKGCVRARASSSSMGHLIIIIPQFFLFERLTQTSRPLSAHTRCRRGRW